MKLLKFKFKNIFSLGDGEFDLRDRGLVLVTGYSEDEHGANGAGKSSISNKGILWTLYGRTVGGLQANDVVNVHRKGKCFGEITFLGIDGREYTVRRERPAKLFLLDGKKEISASTAKATQELIDTLLGFDFKTFTQTSVFGQGKSIHYPSLAPKDQKAVLEQILPMDQADRWAIYTHGVIRETKPLLKDLETQQVSSESQVQVLSDQIKQCKKDIDSFEETKKQNIVKARKKLYGLQQEYKSKLAVLRRAIPTGFDLQTTTAQIQELQRTVENNREQYEKSKAQWEEAGNIGGQWNYKLKTLRAEKAELDTSTKCPTCLRDYDETTVEAIAKKVEEQDRKIAKATENYNQCEAAIRYYSTEKDNYLAAAKAAEQEIIKLNQQIDEYNQFNQRKQMLQSEKQTNEKHFETNLRATEESENPYTANLERLEESLEAATATNKALRKKILKLSREIEHLSYWHDIYNRELKLKLFENACPFLDARTKYHLDRLKNSQIHCEFSTVKRLASGDIKEEFNVTIWSETGGRGFESLSGGEQQIVNFAVGLALADLAGQTTNSRSGVMIADEPLTELDSRNSEAVVDYLTSEIGNGKDTIFLISNEESLKGLIQNRIHVIKSKGITSVAV